MTAPCKGCADRHHKCHGHCEKYLAYRAELDAIREKIRLDSLGADVAANAIYSQRSTLKYTDAGRRALKQR